MILAVKRKKNRRKLLVHDVLECPLPDFHPLIEELTVSPDLDSAGVLILDPTSQPKKWRLVSTREPTIVYLPQSIERITVLDKKDDVMINVRLMQIEFRNGESPLPSGSIKHVCCFPSDEIMQSMVRVCHGSERLKGRAGQGGGWSGRKGRGEGGRNRGPTKMP